MTINPTRLFDKESLSNPIIKKKHACKNKVKIVFPLRNDSFFRMNINNVTFILHYTPSFPFYLTIT